MSSPAVNVVSLEDFTSTVSSKYSDVIGKKLGGSIISFSDEWFAAADNLIAPSAPVREVGRFTPAGAWYDGWETRRHNTEPADWVIIKLGVASAQIIATEVDTAFFNGNHAPSITVEATYLPTAEVEKLKVSEQEYLEKQASWDLVVEETECGPSQRHFFSRKDGLTNKVYTHARLKMYPDGGIARFRLYGQPTAVKPTDPNEEVDLAHVANGGVAVSFSDQHFGAVDNLLIPGRGKDMGDGWETKRSREKGHVDWVIVRLGLPGYIDRVVVDTAHFKGNFPQSITVEGLQADTHDVSVDDPRWAFVVPQAKTGPHKVHEYIRDGETSTLTHVEAENKESYGTLQATKEQVYTHVKMTIIPDGGVKRLRVYGRVKF